MERGRVRGRRRAVHRGGLKLTKVGVSRVSPCDRDEQVLVVRNSLLSREDEILPATVTTSEGEVNGTVENSLEKRGEECSVLTVSLKLELRRVRDRNASLAAAVNQYKVRVERFEQR